MGCCIPFNLHLNILVIIDNKQAVHSTFKIRNSEISKFNQDISKDTFLILIENQCYISILDNLPLLINYLYNSCQTSSTNVVTFHTHIPRVSPYVSSPLHLHPRGSRNRVFDETIHSFIPRVTHEFSCNILTSACMHTRTCINTMYHFGEWKIGGRSSAGTVAGGEASLISVSATRFTDIFFPFSAGCPPPAKHTNYKCLLHPADD